MVAALDRARPGTAERVGPLLGAPGPPSFDGLVTALVNELTTNRVRRCWCSTTTARELEILRLLAAGLRNPRIAAELVVTIDTVKKHVSHILGKLGAANHTEAVTRARELGLIP